MHRRPIKTPEAIKEYLATAKIGDRVEIPFKKISGIILKRMVFRQMDTVDFGSCIVDTSWHRLRKVEK